MPRSSPVPPPCLAPASCFQGCSFHPSLPVLLPLHSHCALMAVAFISGWETELLRPVRQRRHFWRACLKPAPHGLCSPSPFGHKSSLKCEELSAAAVCKALRCLQPHRLSFPCLSPPSSLWEAGLPPTLPQGRMHKLMGAGRRGLCWLFPLQPLCRDVTASD